MYTVKGLNLFVKYIRTRYIIETVQCTLYNVQIVHFTVQFMPMSGHFCLKNDKILNNASGSVSQYSNL